MDTKLAPGWFDAGAFPGLTSGNGIYGIVTLPIVALCILRDSIWHGKGSSPR